MNLRRAEVRAWFNTFLPALGGSDVPPGGVDVVVFPSFPLLDTTALAARGTQVEFGGQDAHPLSQGAFTGDVSAGQLVDCGCGWALVGHSERRRDHGEDDLLIGRKLAAAARAGLKPLVCLGETRDQRLAGATGDVLAAQLRGVLAGIAESGVSEDGVTPHFDIAYEPVWAIGTGETATPQAAQDAHALLRSLLSSSVGAERAGSARILYGGSATPETAPGLFGGDIDGFLVGGASLDPARFLGIVRVCSSASGT